MRFPRGSDVSLTFLSVSLGAVCLLVGSFRSICSTAVCRLQSHVFQLWKDGSLSMPLYFERFSFQRPKNRSFYSLAHLLNACNSRVWTGSKPGTRSQQFHPGLRWETGTPKLMLSTTFFRCLSRKPDQKCRVADTEMSTPIWGVSVSNNLFETNSLAKQIYRECKIFYLLPHFPNGCNGQSQVQVRSLLGVSGECRVPVTFAILWSFCRP